MDNKIIYNVSAKRYSIESWVCDWGIYDNHRKQFIGSPLASYPLACSVLEWFLISIKYNEL